MWPRSTTLDRKLQGSGFRTIPGDIRCWRAKSGSRSRSHEAVQCGSNYNHPLNWIGWICWWNTRDTDEDQLYIYWKKKSMYKWTCSVHAWVVQSSTVLLFSEPVCSVKWKLISQARPAHPHRDRMMGVRCRTVSFVEAWSTNAVKMEEIIPARGTHKASAICVGFCSC